MADFKMICGTEGNFDYLAFARKGHHALGIKPLPIAPGHDLGVPDTVYFSARLRGAVAGDLFAGGYGEVVQFSRAATPNEAWPGIAWEKTGEAIDGTPYCSTRIGIFVPATTSVVTALEEQVTGAKLAHQMTEYLVNLAGAGCVVLSQEVLSAWLHDKYKAMVDEILTGIAQHNVAAEALAGTVGTFEAHAAMLKKIYEQTGPIEVEKPADAD
jgi:hypothetical protein